MWNGIKSVFSSVAGTVTGGGGGAANSSAVSSHADPAANRGGPAPLVGFVAVWRGNGAGDRADDDEDDGDDAAVTESAVLRQLLKDPIPVFDLDAAANATNADANDADGASAAASAPASSPPPPNLHPRVRSVHFEPLCVIPAHTDTATGDGVRCWNVAWHPSGTMFATCGADRAIRVWRRSAAGDSNASFATAGSGAPTPSAFFRTANTNNNVNNSNAAGDDTTGASPATALSISSTSLQRPSPTTPTPAQVQQQQQQQQKALASSSFFVQACQAIEHERTVRRVSWSPDGKYLCASSFDGCVSVWRLFECPGATRVMSTTLLPSAVTGARADSSAAAVPPPPPSESSRTASNSSFSTMIIPAAGATTSHDDGAGRVASAANNNDHDNDNTAVGSTAAALNGSFYIGDGSLLQLELETILEGHENEVKGCAFDPLEGKYLASCSRDRSVWLWEKVDGAAAGGDDVDGGDEDGGKCDFECLSVLGGHSQDVKSVAFAPSVLSQLVSAPSGSKTAGQTFPPDAFDPRRLDLVSASYDDTCKVWRNLTKDGDDWNCVQTITNHRGTVWEARFQPQGIYLPQPRESIQFAQSAVSPDASFSKNPLLAAPPHQQNTRLGDKTVTVLQRPAAPARIAAVSEPSLFPALACCSDDGSVSVHTLTVPPNSPPNLKLSRVAKWVCAGTLRSSTSAGAFHDSDSAITSLDWLPPLYFHHAESTSAAADKNKKNCSAPLLLLSRSSLFVTCGTDDRLCVVECDATAVAVGGTRAESMMRALAAPEARGGTVTSPVAAAAAPVPTSTLRCVHRAHSLHSLEMNCVRVCPRWESVELVSSPPSSQDGTAPPQHLGAATVIVLTAGDDGAVVVQRMRIEFE